MAAATGQNIAAPAPDDRGEVIRRGGGDVA